MRVMGEIKGVAVEVGGSVGNVTESAAPVNLTRLMTAWSPQRIDGGHTQMHKGNLLQKAAVLPNQCHGPN